MIGITHLLLGDLIASKIAATGHKITIKDGTIDKRGKIKQRPPRAVSDKIRQRKSKRTKVVRRTA